MEIGQSSSLPTILCTGVFLVAFVLPYFLLSRLTKIEHDDFHELWEKDGNPHGMPFWFPHSGFDLINFR